MPSSRWDRLYEIQKTTLVDHLMTEAAKTVAEELLGDWPPAVDVLDERASAEFLPVLDGSRPRPPLPAILQGIRLARLDLARDDAAFDEYVRNARWREHGLDDDQKVTLLFVRRWLVEHLLSLSDATEGRVKRKDLLVCLARVEARLVPS